MQGNLVIRADCDAEIGNGHVMRCLGMAQAWVDAGGAVTFVTAINAPTLEARLRSEDIEVIRLAVQPGNEHDAIQTTEVARGKKAPWIVVDGYHFGTDYQRIIKDAGLQILFIDDTGHAEFYYADIVLNQNVYAYEDLYAKRDPSTRLLLGPRYILLRREFWKWKGWRREVSDEAHRVLVTLGGGDPANVTLRVVNALKGIDFSGLEAKIVVGPSNPHTETLQHTLRSAPCSLNIVQGVEDMADLIAWADMAISGGGTTCWELAFMGLPSVIFALAENQRSVTEALHSLEIAQSLGWFAGIKESVVTRALKELMLDSKRRKTMADRGQQLVDGVGIDRVISAMNNPAQPIPRADDLRVRHAFFQDAELLWEWASDPVVRANSFHPEPISLHEHIKWYERKLLSPECSIWIIELNGEAVAQVRYDLVDHAYAKIDFSVKTEFRGRGLGPKALSLTWRSACKQLGATCVRGIVFEENKASAAAFLKAFFCQTGQRWIQGRLCKVFEREYS